MPLKSYGVLVGQVVDRRREGGGSSPHYQLHVRAEDVDYRVAVNVLSQQAPSELLFLAVDNFAHPSLDELEGLADGYTGLPPGPVTGALDYVRGNLLRREDMRPLPPDVPGPENDLADRLEHYAVKAIAVAGSRIYAFGEQWGPETAADPVFGFSPGRGVHDIHLNQGNSGSFVTDDGVWQDGGLLFRFGQQWSAVFLAFQSQSWHTDDRTGHAIAAPVGPAPVRIIAALVDPAGPAPEAETVTLLACAASPLDLTGWTLVDRLGNRQPLSGRISPGAALGVPVAPPFQLGNTGGAISLLDAKGRKVDGVSYDQSQLPPEGWTLTF
jgi:uncharacterized protein YukJ